MFRCDNVMAAMYARLYCNNCIGKLSSVSVHVINANT